MAERAWTDLELYVLHEHIEDFQDGIITRRELLRRVSAMTGSVAAALTLLPALGCDLDRPRAGASPAPTSAAVPTETATAAPEPAYATPPAAPTADGVTVREDDPRIDAGPAVVRAPDGADLLGYRALPTERSRGGVLVIHENRGLTAHIEDVVRRVATAGYPALSIDLLSREGGADRVDAAEYPARLSGRDLADMLADLRAALDALREPPYGAGDRMAAVGFCFGGGMTWNLVATGAPLRAAAPFYGPAPRDLEALAATSIAVLGVYAERDTRITDGAPQIEERLARSGAPHEVVVYPGVDHAFHNDTGARYDATQARAAWVATIEWFERHLA